MTQLKKKKAAAATFEERQRLDLAAEQYIDQHCRTPGEPVQSQSFAEALGVSAPYASSLGSRVWGRGLLKVLREKQIHVAEGLLIRTPLSVKQIAALCGFGSRATFYRAFVKANGMPPAAFRRLKK